MRRCEREPPGSIRARCIPLAPVRLDRYPHGVTGHVAHPVRSIQARCIERQVR